MEISGNNTEVNSVAVASRFASEMHPFSPIMAEYQIIGGVNSAALAHPDTLIDYDSKTVVAPDGLHLPTTREDGSKRDLDIFVASSKPPEINFVNYHAHLYVQDELELSVFGIRPHEVLQAQVQKPMGYHAIKTFLSDRYETPDGLVKSLFPFAVKLDPESLETWSLIVDDSVIPIPNPAMSVVNYLNRSITGLRPKDENKVQLIAGNVFEKSPALRDWAIDGPAASQVVLGSLLYSLNPVGVRADVLGVNSDSIERSELMNHDAFMLPELSDTEKAMLIGSAATKAALLSFFESQEWIVGMFNRMKIEQSLGSIVNNK